MGPGAAEIIAAMIIAGHLVRTVSIAMILVLFVFAAINSVVALVDELGGIRDGYQLPQVLEYIALTTPRRLYELIPYVCLIGALVGLGGLAADSELVVLRAAGVSTLRVGLTAIIPALLFVALGAGLGEWLAPVAEERAEANRAAALGDARSAGPVRWYREGDLFVQVSGRRGASVLSGVVQYVFDESQMLLISRRARRAEHQPSVQGWNLEDVFETRFAVDRLELRTEDHILWRTSATPDVLSSRLLTEPSKLSTNDLRGQIAYLESEGFDAGEYRLAVWRKLSQPLAVVSLVLLAASFVSGPLREAGNGLRLGSGILVGLGFKYVQDLLGPASVVFGFSPGIAVIAPVVICVVAALWLIRVNDRSGRSRRADDFAARRDVRP